MVHVKQQNPHKIQQRTESKTKLNVLKQYSKATLTISTPHSKPSQMWSTLRRMGLFKVSKAPSRCQDGHPKVKFNSSIVMLVFLLNRFAQMLILAIGTTLPQKDFPLNSQIFLLSVFSTHRRATVKPTTHASKSKPSWYEEVHFVSRCKNCCDKQYH